MPECMFSLRGHARYSGVPSRPYIYRSRAIGADPACTGLRATCPISPRAVIIGRVVEEPHRSL